MIWPTFLTGKTFGETAYLTARAGLVLAVLGLLVWGFGSGRFWAWRAGVWKERAVESAGRALVEKAAKESAEQGAANATRARGEMDAGTQDIHITVEQAAAKVEAHENRPIDPDDRAAVDADSLRELEAAQRKARATADRLRGADRP